MRTICLLISTCLVMAACGDEVQPSEEPQGSPFIDGRFMLIAVHANQGGGTEELSFAGLLRFSYELIAEESRGGRYREEIFGAVNIGSSRLDCGGMERKEILVSPAGEVLESRVLHKGCTGSGLLAKPVTGVSIHMLPSADLVKQLDLGGTEVRFKANRL